MPKGLFISFEGGEGAGKSTLIENVYQELLTSEHSVIRTFEPGGTQIGEKIREILLFSKDDISPLCELALFLASRAQHVEKTILPALKQGKIILCDRFHDSTIAYQGIARGLGKKDLYDLCLYFSQSLEPDITFYLDIDPKLGFLRGQSLDKDRIEKEDIKFHQKVRFAFLELAEENPKRIHVIDASLTPFQISEKVMHALSSKLSN